MWASFEGGREVVVPHFLSCKKSRRRILFPMCWSAGRGLTGRRFTRFGGTRVVCRVGGCVFKASCCSAPGGAWVSVQVLWVGCVLPPITSCEAGC